MSVQDETTVEVTTKEAEVCCSGVSYFTREPVLGATGEVTTGDRGEELYVTLRKEATMGQVIELTEHEFNRLFALGAIQEPGSSPLPGQPGRPIRPTPFGIPVPDPDYEGEGEAPLTAYKGPVMGDPTAVSEVADPSNPNQIHAATLSAAEAARLEEEALKAAGQTQENGEDAAALRSGYEEEDKEVLEAEAQELGIEVSRSDGRDDLPPRKVDYVDALVDYRSKEAQE